MCFHAHICGSVAEPGDTGGSAVGEQRLGSLTRHHVLKSGGAGGPVWGSLSGPPTLEAYPQACRPVILLPTEVWWDQAVGTQPPTAPPLPPWVERAKLVSQPALPFPVRGLRSPALPTGEMPATHLDPRQAQALGAHPHTESDVHHYTIQPHSPTQTHRFRYTQTHNATIFPQHTEAHIDPDTHQATQMPSDPPQPSCTVRCR